MTINLTYLLTFADTIISGEQTETAETARFKRLIDKYAALISRLCYAYARDVDDFNDLRQDSLINLWRGLPSYRGESEETTWIYRVVLNTCVSFVRKKSSRRDTVGLAEILEPADHSDPENTRSIQLYEAIYRLSDEDKALILMWLDEKPYEEIAEVMGYHRNTVAVKLHRIKEKLKKNILRYDRQ